MLEVEITAAQGAAAASTNTLTTAQTRLASATQAAGGFVARLSSAVPIVGAISRGFASFIGLLGGPLSAGILALGAVAVAFQSIETRTERVARNNRELEDTIDQIRQAYSDANGEAESFLENIEAISLSRALEGQRLAINEFNQGIRDAESVVDTFRQRLESGLAGEGLQQVVAEFDNFFAQVRQGDGDFEQLSRRLDDIGAANPEIRSQAVALLGLTGRLSEYSDSAELASANVRFLTDTATDADRALLGLGQSANNAAADVVTLSNAADDALGPLQQLQGLVPVLAQAARARQQVATADAALAAGLADIQRERESGLITTADEIAGINVLQSTYRQAIAEIDGTAEATRNASSALSEYVDSANVNALEGQARAISVATTEYENLRSQLVAAGADQRQLNDLQLAFQQNLANIERDFADTGGGGSGRGGNAADRLREQREEMERLTAITQELNGVDEQLLQRQSDLNFLLQNGTITAEQFAAAMRDLNVETTALNNSFSGGLANGIARVAQQTNELGAQVSNFVVGAFDQATNAIVEFARTGEFNVRAFFQDLFSQLLQLAANQIFAQLLGGLGGGAGFLGGGGGGGGFLGGLLGFQNGGSFNVGGSGGTDSQLVAFRATPNERVTVETPGQQRAREDGSQGGNATPQDITVVNNLDPSLLGRFLQSPDGRRVLVNTLTDEGVINA